MFFTLDTPQCITIQDGVVIDERVNWGGGGSIFIYSCSQTVKTIDFQNIKNAQNMSM